MPTESSPNLNNDERLSLQLRLLNEAAAGHLDDLECPKCREAAVSVWFMHPAADVYTDLMCAVNVPYRYNRQSTFSHFCNPGDTFRASVFCG
jgi:hypothetical protein